MRILGYGEDALTLWAVAQRTSAILAAFGDKADPDRCLCLCRPSFGRRGGGTSSEFGEFDFIIATFNAVYLGEAKWDKSPELQHRPIRLKGEQLLRHKVFAAYYREWISRNVWVGNDFFKSVQDRFTREGIQKPTPPPGSLLGRNLISILGTVATAANRSEQVRNILLVVDTSGTLDLGGQPVPEGFRVVCIDASRELENGLIPLKMT